MAGEVKKNSSAGPLFAVLALASIAGVAYLAYRRASGKGETDVDDLLDMASKATKKLEDRLHEFATVLS